MVRKPRVAKVKKPVSRLWLFVNSGLFLWLLTAVFVTIGGSYFSQIQKCVADADALGERYYILTRELSNRNTEFARAIHVAESIEALKRAKAEYKSDFAEFQAKTGDEIESEWRHIIRRVDTRSLSVAMTLSLSSASCSIESVSRFMLASFA